MLSSLLMNGFLPVKKSTLIPPFANLLLLTAMVFCAWPAGAQQIVNTPQLNPQEVMSLVRSGTFEIWQGPDRIGVEKYTIFKSVTGDTLVTRTEADYDLTGPSGPVEFHKAGMLLTHALDAVPLFFQSREERGESAFSLSASLRDTVVQIFEESNDRGEGITLAIPEGKLYLFDPAFYTHIELLVGEFGKKGIESRTHKVLVPKVKKVLEISLVRRGEERVELASGAETDAIRVDLSDKVTVFHTWIDEEGRMLLLETGNGSIRVMRRSLEQGGETDS